MNKLVSVLIVSLFALNAYALDAGKVDGAKPDAVKHTAAPMKKASTLKHDLKNPAEAKIDAAKDVAKHEAVKAK